MTTDLAIFAARLRERCFVAADVRRLTLNEETNSEPRDLGCYGKDFNSLALELFALQHRHNPAYRKICEARKASPNTITYWTQIPAVPTAAFKELEMTCLPPNARTAVFHSSGTTEQRPSRHFHNAESLAVYEASLWPWFEQNLRFTIYDLRVLCLTPPPSQAAHSSLVYMFDIIRRKFGADESAFFGRVGEDGSWMLDFEATLAALESNATRHTPHATLLLGTAFSFVHLLNFLAEKNLRLALPPGSRVMETGGYKGRSRSLPKAELHSLITERLGVPASHIICEYGMSELSSQAYDLAVNSSRLMPDASRLFHFPPWARVQIISPETGREVAEGETGLIRVFDLANVFSVMAIQTEDLAVCRGDGFELLGRAAFAESRGCSLLSVESYKS
jgi:hypothetical protein